MGMTGKKLQEVIRVCRIACPEDMNESEIWTDRWLGCRGKMVKVIV
jgi:hypothetical protein